MLEQHVQRELALAAHDWLGAEQYAHGSGSCCSENVLSLTHSRQRSGVGWSCSSTCSSVKHRVFSFPFLSRLLSVVLGNASSLFFSDKRETRICVWFPLEVSPPKLDLLNTDEQWLCYRSLTIPLSQQWVHVAQQLHYSTPAEAEVSSSCFFMAVSSSVSFWQYLFNYLLCSLFMRPSAGRGC